MKKKYPPLVIAIMLIFAFSIYAQNSNKLKLYGDVRFRTELDRSSNKKDGTTRNDRDRFRYRLRFGFKYSMTDNIEFGGRIRSGNPMNQQSPHVTFGNEFHSGQFSIDKAYIKVKCKNGLWGWAGKNGMPFWEQNELLWDGDVNPEGLSVGGNFKPSENLNIAPVLGYYIAGHSGKSFGDDATLMIAQLKFNTNLSNNAVTFSSGIISAKNLPEKPDYAETFTKDYNIWATSLQLKLKDIGLTIGADYFNNLTSYDDNVNIADIFKDQKTGYVASIKYGINNFQFGYYYVHIEKYAVIDYFAQDDWMRWGNSNYTRSSNFGGHEFRIKYKITNKFNTVLRTYIIEGLKIIPGGTELETGTRIRLDFNIKF